MRKILEKQGNIKMNNKNAKNNKISYWVMLKAGELTWNVNIQANSLEDAIEQVRLNPSVALSENCEYIEGEVEIYGVYQA